MNERLCVITCENLREEFATVVAAQGWNDVVTATFAARCGRPPVTFEELRELVPEDSTQVVAIGRACLSALGPPPCGFVPVRIYKPSECFHVVANAALIDEALAQGAYLITPEWLANWPERLAQLGFKPAQAAEFFQDFARKIVFLDTGIDAQSTARLAQFQAVVGIPAQHLTVGLDHLRLHLTHLVLSWQLERERRTRTARERQHQGELADHAAAIDLISQLARTQDETQAIAVITDMFRMLFAPATLHYLRLEHDVPEPQTPIPLETLDQMRSLHADHAWSPDHDGFMVRIARGKETLGVVAVEAFEFPQYRDRYLNMALALTGICGLAVENGRTRTRLMQAEKMASLGIVVAGVAHEINTPLGVGLAAASALHGQAQTLAGDLSGRTMTRSSLDDFLASAQTCTRLISANLERIAHLVDAFRQVAVGKLTADSTRFSLLECIDEVIRSFGAHLPAQRISVSVECDPRLEIESTRSDWTSIFVNLMGNSLRHGFGADDLGRIAIGVRTDGNRLHMDYSDDGTGMTAHALAHIFDPFFTTDMQHGMGLGMNLVYNLVTHRMSGTIQCDSQPGKGMQCRIDVPLRLSREAAQ